MTAIPTEDRSLSQWWTPEELADRIVSWSGVVPGSRVLEPSAGIGRLAAPLLRRGAEVVAVELDKRLHETLSEALAKGAVAGRTLAHLRSEDFLTLAPEPVDLAVINPPYERGLDGQFLARCHDWAPRVVGLYRTAILQGARRLDGVWSKIRPSRVALLASRPRFGGDHSPSQDYAVIETVSRGADSVSSDPSLCTLEWWA